MRLRPSILLLLAALAAGVRADTVLGPLPFTSAHLAQRGRVDLNLGTMDQGRAQDFAARLVASEVRPGETVYRVNASTEGWVRVRGNQIAGTRIRVYHRGAEIPVWTVNPGTPTPADADFRFLARGYQGTASDAGVYAVVATTEPGLTMAAVPRPPASGLATSTSHTALSVLDRELYYIPAYRPYDATIDHWFTELFYSTQDRVVTFPSPNRIPSGNAKLWLRAGDKDAVAGNTPTRTVDARSGSTVLASLNYKEQGTNWVSATVSAASLSANSTVLTFRNRTAGANPILGYVHELALEYPAENRAVNDELALVRPAAAENVLITGFTSADIVALDTTDGSRPLRLTGLSVFPTNGSFAASFHRVTNTTNAYLVTTLARRTDATLTPVNFTASTMLTARTNQADWVVIAPDPNSSALLRLAAHRRAQGLSTRIISLTAAYDAFGFGHRDPAVLRQALGYMFHHWVRPAPRHVLLVGDATFDPRDRQATGRPDELPTRFGPGPYEWGAQDPWFARVNGNDTLPDLALGRLPTANETLLGVMVDKIIAFESAVPNASWRTRATLIADKLDASAGNFKARSETLRAAHFGAMSVTTGYVDDESGATVRAKTFSTYANGARILQYMGHGLHDRWADTPAGLLFNNADSGTLGNFVHPIVTVFACQNGQFQGGPFTAGVEGLCETLLEQSKGAVATIGASAEAVEIGSAAWADGLWSGMLTRRKHRLGDAQRDAWASAFALSSTTAELQLYHLFGDPALVVNPISSAAADSDGDGMTDGFELDRGLQAFVADADGDLDGDGAQNLDEFQRGTRPDRPDTDGDGLADGLEAALGTNPLLADTDGDLLPDAWESQNGGNPLVADATADPDGDHLSQADERALGTHPQRADTDGDGLADDVEILAGRDPLNPFDLAPGTADADGDGLSWANERLLGTNPGRADTDGDGRSDGAEVGAGTNPLVADTDGDGLSDGAEFAFGSNPLLSDTDGDGVSDAREQQYGLNPLLSDGNADPDGDGLVVLEELFHGTNPVVADSDGDGLNDGVELRVRLTKPLKSDTDGDGLTDGEEVLTHGTNPLVKDTDNDGLQDKTETTAGSNPLLADTDGDTLPDLWEWSNGLNLLMDDRALDKDGDGLTNLQERQAGTAANRVDSDNDGLSDFAELNTHGSNPTRYDTDFDTAHDGQEIAAGTNPNVTDTDGDGMSDGYEIAQGLNPLVNDAALDPDGDLVTNLVESQQFTNANLADSDGDGLSDKYEIDNGMVPRLFDRDRDGLSDGAEVLTHGTNPALLDTDGDGLSDGLEVLTSLTNPLVADTDGDGLSDKVERDFGLNPLVNDVSLDPDGDGLTNLQEVQNNCLPSNADSDGDGLNDGQEVLVRLTLPRTADTDGDGLSDGNEVNARGSDPKRTDTDGDGMPDGWEAQHSLNPLARDHLQDVDADGVHNLAEFRAGTNPRLADTDGDAVTDLQEILGGTSPLLTDTDSDGLPDGWELANGTNPLVADATRDEDGDTLTNAEEHTRGTPVFRADADGDGMPDGWEVTAGTNPLLASSVLRLELIPGPTWTARWPGVVGKTYRLMGRVPGGPPTVVIPNISGTAPLTFAPFTPAGQQEIWVELQ